MWPLMVNLSINAMYYFVGDATLACKDYWFICNSEIAYRFFAVYDLDLISYLL